MLGLEAQRRRTVDLQFDLTWIIDPNSVQKVGCIHTCQGLEVDYIGVIIGPDLIYRNGSVLVDPTKRSKDDKSIFGYKKLLQTNPERTRALLRVIIRITYRTLMTKGMKGCYVYCCDKELQEILKKGEKTDGYDSKDSVF